MSQSQRTLGKDRGDTFAALSRGKLLIRFRHGRFRERGRIHNERAPDNLLVGFRNLSEQFADLKKGIALSQRLIPESIKKLLPVDDEPYQLSETDFLKLDSFLGQKPLKLMVHPKNPEAENLRQYNVVMEQLMVLRDFNRKLRESMAPQASLPPANAEEADAQGYVESYVACDLLGFKSPPRLTEYLDEHHETIRQYKPSERRRMVHAADLLKALHHQKILEENARLAAHGDPKQRKPPNFKGPKKPPKKPPK